MSQPSSPSVAPSPQIVDSGVYSDEVNNLLVLAARIAQSAEVVRLTRDSTVAFSRRVNELVVTIATELEECHSAPAGTAPPIPDGELRNFERALQRTCDELAARSRRTYLSQLLHREADAEKLKVLDENLTQAFAAIAAAGRLRHSQTAEATLQSIKASRALKALNEHFAAIALQGHTHARSASILSIPPRPQIFFGRATELGIVESLVTAYPPSRVAVLGAPGMGKTSLAVTALHADDVAARYGDRRFFVPCDAAEDRSNCVFHVASTLGISTSKPQGVEKALVAFLASAPSVIVLDNFESVWESPNRRLDAERALQVLAGIETLALVITMRGTELPDGVLWSKSLLRPLQPLTQEASRQVFLAISDDPRDDPSLSILLDLVENVPLAVTLLANIAQVESCDSMLRRWNAQKTAMVQRAGGTTKLTSLDVSISFSIQSSRIQAEPAALQLLSLLSVLKHGPMDTDLGLMTSDALRNNPTVALSALLQTALCQRMPTGRLHVLSPIRQFILTNYPVNLELARPFYAHYFSFADLFHKEKGSVDFGVPSLLAEVDDIFSVVHHALESGFEARPAVKAAIACGTLFLNDGVGSPDVLFAALTVAQAEGFDDLAAKCLDIWASLINTGVVPGNAMDLLLQARALYEKIGDIRGIIEITLESVPFLPLDAALASCEQIRPLVDSHSSGSTSLLSIYVRKLAGLYERAGRNRDAQERFHELITIQRHSPNPDPRAVAYSMFRIADLEADTGHLRAATARLRELIDHLRTIHWPALLALTYNLLGRISLAQGNVDTAIRDLQHGQGLWRPLNNAPNMLIGLFDLVRAYIGQGNMPAAADTLRNAQDIVDTLGAHDVYERTLLLHASGEIALWSDDLSGARVALHSAIITSYRRGAARSDEHLLQLRAGILTSLGDVESQAGDVEQSCIDFLVAATINRRIAYPRETVRALCGFAQVVEDSAAEPLLISILPLLRLYGLRRLLAGALAHMGTILQRRGNFGEAERKLTEAISHYDATNDHRGIIRADAVLASLEVSL